MPQKKRRRKTSQRDLSGSRSGRLRFERLEDRRLFAISGAEMEFIYDLNFARHDPQAYDDVMGHPGLLSGVAARPPLAVNDQLVESAEWHSQDMVNLNYFAHQSIGAPDYFHPNEMVRNAGYDLNSGFPDDNNYVESLAAGTVYFDAATVLSELIYDEGVDPPGHRYHLLATGPSDFFWANHTEIGVGYEFGFSATYTNYWTVHTAYRNDTSLRFLTGVVYDDTNDNGRYDSGEGLSGVSVDVDGTPVTTNAAGGWSLSVANGTYNISVSGAGYTGASSTVATVSGDNVQVDFIQGEQDGYVNFTQTPGSPPPLASDPQELVSFNPVTGEWEVVDINSGTPSTSDYAAWSTTHPRYNVVAGDWDGDGDSDVAARLASGRWYVGLNNGEGAFVTTVGWLWDAGSVTEEVFVGDADGDGRDDIIHRTSTGRWEVSRLTDASGYNVELWTTWGAQNGWHFTQVDDFNGDGRVDIASRASWGRWFVGVSDGSQFNTTSWTQWSVSIPRTNVRTGDFNGDGRADLVHQTDAGVWYVSLSSGSSFTNHYFGRWSTSVVRLDFQIGDFNGDGRDDIIARTTSGHWYVGESSGTAFVTDYYGRWTGNYLFAKAGDYDGDGDLDMAGLTTSGAWELGTSSGDDFATTSWGIFSSVDADEWLLGSF